MEYHSHHRSMSSPVDFNDEDIVAQSSLWGIIWSICVGSIVLLISVALLQRYISFLKTSKLVYFTVLVGYIFSIGILFLIPVDIDIVCIVVFRLLRLFVWL